MKIIAIDTTSKKLDYAISMNGVGIHIWEHMIGLYLPCFTEKLHGTIAFNIGSDDINFHVTKNIGDVKNKPSIRVCEINKKMFNELLPKFAYALLEKVLQPLHMDYLKIAYRKKFAYIPLKNMENVLKHKSIEDFVGIAYEKSKNNKRKVKVESEIIDTVKGFAKERESRQAIFSNILKKIPSKFETPFEIGLLLINGKVLHVLRLNNDWFTTKRISPFEMLTVFVQPMCARRLIVKTKQAIEALKKAETFADVAHLTKNPITLISI